MNAHMVVVLIKMDYTYERACVRHVVNILSLSLLKLPPSLYKTETEGRGG